MKKLSACIIIIYLISGNAQIFAQKYGLQGGLNFSDMIIKDNSSTYGNTNDKLIGFNAGLTIGYEISKLAEFEVGIILESRGSRYESENSLWELRTNYLDIPLLFKVGPTFGSIKVYGAAGPYLGLGVSGFYTYNIGGRDFSSLVNWGKDRDDLLKRMDLGTKFGIGAETMHFMLGAYYSLGLVNISAVRNNGRIMHNRGMSFCVGYRF